MAAGSVVGGLLLEDARQRVLIAPEPGGGIVSIEALAAGGPVPVLRGSSGGGMFDLGLNVLVPFSNRISGGGFESGGRFHDMAPNVEGEAFPIHGDGFQKPWEVRSASRKAAVLHLADGRCGPFRYEAVLRYELRGAGLNCALEVTNRGAALPFGGGFHPWFPRNAGTKLQFDAGGVWLEDERHLPAGHVALDASPWAFLHARYLPAGWINNAFTGWDGRARIIQPELGIEVAITAQPPLDVAVVYSPDDAADFFCFEPVSHAVDAHNMAGKPGLIVLENGGTMVLSMEISWSAIARAGT